MVPKTYQKTPYGNNGFLGALSMGLAFLEQASIVHLIPSRPNTKRHAQEVLTDVKALRVLTDDEKPKKR